MPWSTAHGLAVLLVDGPLIGLPEEIREEAIDRVLDTTIAGICGPAAPSPPGPATPRVPGPTTPRAPEPPPSRPSTVE
jgi:hypothetical protein